MSLGDFLTNGEIKRCIGKQKPWITEHIIKPNLERINKTLGQENDADYLSYLVEYICNPQQTDSI